MPLFKKTLYSTDFSPLAEVALNYVKKLKEAGEEEVVVVHVVDDLSAELPEGTDLLKEKELYKLLPEDDQEYLLDLIQRLEAVEKELQEAGLKVKKVLRYGNVAKQIVSVADEENVNIVVMGAHGKGLLAELILGSVSTDVIRLAKCPVLIVKQREE
ncbi:universal stress protein [Thermovibrio ammonificans]|jgi:nucleotide-binding universal stress UspA family protein|uniref:UspA domain-containing protein n=1 Tax=Thermovibrio ammonificans (strain DSM 15698 / JCM 12110 / HB-1) TaxID=648996 RepID=E8T454_THEA1|nr:universal stress protein [Thermovibrio ammonificans]ADU97383.1 UspA domain-containing protein [Thermovibrio ammonificans HB-1]